MTLDEYGKLFPNENVWRGRHDDKNRGMIQFDEETACNLAGPFEGNYAYFSITDWREVKLAQGVPTEAEYRQRHRFSQYRSSLGRRHNGPAQDEAHLQRRLAALTDKERKAWQKETDELVIESWTQEKPVGLYIAGNDDSSYTKFFPSLQAAQEELDMLLACQPINMDKDIQDNGFVFTN